jgi:DNA-binding Lrp family transcriptional regulator
MLNEKQKQIIKALRTNARISLLDYSKKNAISQSTVYDLQKKAEKYIRKYSALLDFNKLGYKFHSFLLIKNAQENNLDIEEYLSKHRNVNSLVKTYDYEFLCEVLFSSIFESENFIENFTDRYPTTDVSKFNIAQVISREDFMVSGDEKKNE